MAVVRIHARGLQFQTQHEDVQELFWRYGFHSQCERVVKKGTYHPYKNNRCSAFVWVLSGDVDALLQTNMKQGLDKLELKDAVDNGQELEPPQWLVRVAKREAVTCLHHLPCRSRRKNTVAINTSLVVSLDPKVLKKLFLDKRYMGFFLLHLYIHLTHLLPDLFT